MPLICKPTSPEQYLLHLAHNALEAIWSCLKQSKTQAIRDQPPLKLRVCHSIQTSQPASVYPTLYGLSHRNSSKSHGLGALLAPAPLPSNAGAFLCGPA